MAAALATLDLVNKTNYLEHTVRLGTMLRDGLNQAALSHGFVLNQTGPVQMPMILFNEDPDLRFSMHFAGGMVQRGIYMAPTHNLFLCAAMTEDDIGQTIYTAKRVLRQMEQGRKRIEPHPVLKEYLGRTSL